MSSLNDELPQCKHYVKRKKRFCRMTVKCGKEYCGEHEPCDNQNGVDTDKRLRIVCPLDGKHTCYAHKLRKHLKICNARQKDPVPYIIKGINYGDAETSITETMVNNRLLSNVSVDNIKTVIKKVDEVYEKISANKINEIFGKHTIVEEELKKPEYGEKTKKHLIQTSSILSILQTNQLLQNNTCYVEFGAGKGQLSYWLSKAIENQENSRVLLVERAAHRHKLDNKLDKSNGRVDRIRADIADLVLEEVDIIKKSEKIVGVTKHLCGDATDLALRCLVKCNVGKNILGTVMAFCCHHRCLWSTYTGKQFFNSNNLTHDDFDVMCGMVSWATCGTGLARDQKFDNHKHDNYKQNTRDIEIGLSRNEKELVGFKCKYILNYGRMKYLEENDFKCKLLYYVESSISPENLCMLAIKSSMMT